MWCHSEWFNFFYHLINYDKMEISTVIFWTFERTEMLTYSLVKLIDDTTDINFFVGVAESVNTHWTTGKQQAMVIYV